MKIEGIQVAGLYWRGDSVDTDKELHEKRISMSLVTWGENRVLPSMTVGTFLDYFYGYVVGR